jgi:DHA2 family multidrug resistance protein
MVERMAAISADPYQVLKVVQGEVSKELSRQALTLAFDDVFILMAWVFAGALVLIPFCRVSPKQRQVRIEPHIGRKTKLLIKLGRQS